MSLAKYPERVPCVDGTHFTNEVVQLHPSFFHAVILDRTRRIRYKQYRHSVKFTLNPRQLDRSISPPSSSGTPAFAAVSAPV